jgi:DNA-binding Lrp family transcriptional regulator
VSNGRLTGISEIAREVGISEKTTTRRLNRMRESQLLDFTIQCDPSPMIGYIQFAIPIIVQKNNYRSVSRLMYTEIQNNILYAPGVIDPNDWLIFVLYADNVFTVDSVLAKVDSFNGVKNADAHILTKWQYYDDWIMEEINKRLLLRPVSHRSR